MAKRKKISKTPSKESKMPVAVPKKTRSGESWADRVKEVRYRDFTVADLREFKTLLESFAASLGGKIETMEQFRIEKLDNVYGATQPARVEKEMRNFLGNVGRAIEKQR